MSTQGGGGRGQALQVQLHNAVLRTVDVDEHGEGGAVAVVGCIELRLDDVVGAVGVIPGADSMRRGGRRGG